MASRRNKEQQKRRKTDNGKAFNVNHGMMDGAQGAKQKVKRVPSMLKNEVFSLVVKNISS